MSAVRIGLVYDLIDDYLAEGFSPEAAAEFDAPETIDALENALCGLGHTVERVGGIHKLVPALASGARWDMVFNIAEGVRGIGREAQVPALLDAYHIPYTFSPPEVMAVTMHKAVTKAVVAAAGIATAPWAVVAGAGDTARVNLPYPLFVKPVAEGTSKGVAEESRVENAAGLAARCASVLTQFHQPALVETYLSGREFTVGIVGHGAGARAIGVMEISFKESGDQSCYSYRNKVGWHEIMTLADDAPARAAASVALAAWRVLGCLDAGRVDIRLDGHGVPHFIEANPLAGLRPAYSELTVLADMAGMTYQQLIGTIMDEAAARYGLQQAREAA